MSIYSVSASSVRRLSSVSSVNSVRGVCLQSPSCAIAPIFMTVEYSLRGMTHHVNSVNPVNSVNHVNSVNYVNSVNHVNNINSLSSI